jgi:hypothetical protein
MAPFHGLKVEAVLNIDIMNLRFTLMKHCFTESKYKATSIPAMEKRSLALALTLTLPLVLYGIPYAYALASSSYTVDSTVVVPPNGTAEAQPSCHSGDYVTGGGYLLNGNVGNVLIVENRPFLPGNNPFAWSVQGVNGGSGSATMVAYAVCQTPIAPAGIGVPEFGSLYVAIAFGAVVYFMLSRRFTRRPAIPSQGLAEEPSQGNRHKSKSSPMIHDVAVHARKVRNS